MVRGSDYEFTLSKDGGVESVLATLHRWGIVHIPNYLDPDYTRKLRSEFFNFFECSEPWIKQLSYRPGWLSKAVAVRRNDIDMQRFPVTQRIFGSDFMAAICDGYLGVPNEFNNAVYLTHDLPNPEPVTILHFDRIYALKFYFYLSDTTRKNGAFEFIPGTHKRGREIRCSYLRKGFRVEDIPIWDLPRARRETIAIESRAGTLIIFDTDGFHRGGVVSEGEERMIMRGHSHTISRDFCP